MSSLYQIYKCAECGNLVRQVPTKSNDIVVVNMKTVDGYTLETRGGLKYKERVVFLKHQCNENGGDEYMPENNIVEQAICKRVRICKEKEGDSLGDGCVLSSICRFYLQGNVVNEPSPTYESVAGSASDRGHGAVKHKQRGPRSKTVFDASYDGYTKAKAFLALKRSENKLTEEQCRALDAMKGQHYKQLSESQKLQVVDIANRVKAAA